MTTGNYGGIDLWLGAQASGQISVKTGPAVVTADIAELGVDEMVTDAGGLDRKLTLQRLPDVVEETRAAFDLTVPVQDVGDTRLYVRVQQIDGHRAWSSPIYLMN